MRHSTVSPAASVSYLVTVYNKAPYLPFMLEGLRRQEGAFDREYIFIDDGSTDDSRAILKRLTAGWDNVTIVEQENRGPAAATNRLIEMASGDYVKPVDGDDVLMPWATQALLDAIRDTGCGVSYSFFPQAVPYDPKGSISPEDLVASAPERPRKVTVDENGLFVSLRGSRMTPTCWLARTDIVRSTRGCDPAIFVQDYSIELQLGLRTHFAEIHGPLYFIPHDPSGRISESMAQLRHDSSMALAGFLRDESGLSDQIRRAALHRAVNRAWGWARRRGKAGLFSQYHRLFLADRLGLLPATAETIFKTCEIFRETDDIRFPPKAAEQATLSRTGTPP